MVEQPEPQEPLGVALQADPIRIVTLVLLGIDTFLVLCLIVYLVLSAASVRATVECLQQTGAELNTSLAASRLAAQQDRAAQRELLLTPSTTQAEGRAAVERFLKRLDDADAARAANPPPVRSCITERETS